MKFREHCSEIADEIISAIKPLRESGEGARVVMQGADGTPTKLIDKVAEDIAVGYIIQNGLCSRIISEEAGIIETEGKPGTIYIDPIDGTHNAITGNPFFGLSMAYSDGERITEGFVRDLVHGETFYSSYGKGAYLDGKRVFVSDTESLEKSTISIYGRKFHPETIIGVGHRIRRMRLFGASSLEICYVGCGRLDGFIDIRQTLRTTDAVAGVLFCSEGGGSITDITGNPVEFPDDVREGRSLIATNGHIHDKVLEYL
ncbi:MAG: bifunctional fructose-bisphosphatase/inositol-phosphate phosphatase [Methanomicrobiaceae archaeon]|nr:bifunctional fructose-bisphosphatase/inositol-phosphate phosphatase [Methanomicrobiaceae archaeon]